jgi:hypothetical protein
MSRTAVVRPPEIYAPAIVARFWSKVEKGEGCWLWRAGVGTKGYGKFSPVRRITMSAHRYAYEATHGPLAIELTTDHLCRVRLCVRPDHLEPVTSAENVLRGVGITAQRARQTTCIRGHELVPSTWPGSRRFCPTCRLERERERHGYQPRRYAADITHCPHGHEYTPANSVVYGGSRFCRTCRRAANHRRWAAT